MADSLYFAIYRLAIRGQVRGQGFDFKAVLVVGDVVLVNG